MLVEPVKDLLDAFVIGAVNRLFTVATVENQHFEPWGAVTGEGTGLRGGGGRVINAKCLSFFGAAVAVLLLPSA